VLLLAECFVDVVDVVDVAECSVDVVDVVDVVDSAACVEVAVAVAVATVAAATLASPFLRPLAAPLDSPMQRPLDRSTRDTHTHTRQQRKATNSTALTKAPYRDRIPRSNYRHREIENQKTRQHRRQCSGDGARGVNGYFAFLFVCSFVSLPRCSRTSELLLLLLRHRFVARALLVAHTTERELIEREKGCEGSSRACNHNDNSCCTR